MDEAGRGPLAGPVVAAAVILDPARPIAGLRDSKQLDARPSASAWRLRIRDRALAWSVAWADPTEIDALNILQATFLAMRRALLGLRADAPRHCRSTATACRASLTCATQLRGDRARRCQLMPAISAASILAKTWPRCS